MPCEDLIQFDIESVTTNIVNEYSMLQFINQQNYDEIKRKYSVNFPEYFSGNYDDFKLARNELTRLFIAAGYSSQQGSSYRRTLSASSAEAYGRCLAENSHKPLSAWVSKSTDNKIAINVRNGLNEDIDIQVVGATPLNPINLLHSAGTQMFMFDYDASNDFMVGFNGISRHNKTTDTALIQLDKVRHFEVRTTRKELTATFTCGAGCHGNREGCRIWTDAVFIADQDYYLLYETRKVVRTEVIGGPGLMNYELQWITDPDAGKKPRRYIAHPCNMNGNSVDTQGIILGTCSIIAERQYIVEVAPT
ncbi:hypothetical protein HH212_24845 [Massilia forsythiae]|uniref:Uncharacterized protein n=1 Tax=Massilia forsythiae TaxID=2728020 RepID=A0A7Z2W143_9BURK|nr:hypothetical protein [Massilia forsythiae]QJE02835.1 hypothetical protein HH212_24845 [Massilia forsythiae]